MDRPNPLLIIARVRLAVCQTNPWVASGRWVQPSLGCEQHLCKKTVQQMQSKSFCLPGSYTNNYLIYSTGILIYLDMMVVHTSNDITGWIDGNIYKDTLVHQS